MSLCVCLLDLEVYGHMQSVVIYPLTTADIYSDAIRKQTESASSLELALENTMPGKPPKGLVSRHVSISVTGLVIRCCFVWH